MICDKLCTALNKQINAEMYSSYLYLSMSAWFEDRSLSGFGNWMRVQAEEETFHAMKMFDYLIERGGRVVLEPIQQPESEWESPLSVIEAVLKHEELVTGLINDLVDISMDVRDHAGTYFLQWYVVAWPIFLIVFVRGCFLLMDQFLHDRSELTPMFMLGVIFIPALLTSFLRWRDIEARYTFLEHYTVAIGGENVFDEYPDDEEGDALGSWGAKYAVTSPFGFNGAFWYARISAAF